MATGFKKATVTAADVPSTQTNFPVFVDLSRLGITTQAEANSIRVYSDEAKTTELAREIVSVDEMHVLIPSLTSTFTIYVDWDGSSADYATTATYGAEAVWTNYEAVWHMEDTTDATGNGHTLTAQGGVTVGGGAGQVGAATDFDGTNDYFDIASPIAFTAADTYTVSYWVSANSADNMVLGNYSDNNSFIWHRSSSPEYHYKNNANKVSKWTSPTYPASGLNWYGFKFNGDDVLHGQINGSDLGAPDYTDASFTSAFDLADLGEGHTNAAFFWDGLMDEVRAANFYASDDWQTTEYNNQSAESTFWGTWTDVGGGGAASYHSARRAHLMAM